MEKYLGCALNLVHVISSGFRTDMPLLTEEMCSPRHYLNTGERIHSTDCFPVIASDILSTRMALSQLRKPREQGGYDCVGRLF